jgi:MerR family transcriptional regulator, thiopeptide resistance regulator
MSYSVGELARSAGISIRTLHHYDEIGLLVPQERTAAGYRRYSHADVERLQRILGYRALGFDLGRIAELLGNADVDPVQHLRRQHELVLQQVERLSGLARTLERTMEAQTMGINLTPAEMLDVFGDFDPTQFADEVEPKPSKRHWRMPWQPACRRTMRTSWTSPSSTVSTSAAGSTTARTKCIRAWRRCT